jgi:hypothetical protein
VDRTRVSVRSSASACVITGRSATGLRSLTGAPWSASLRSPGSSRSGPSAATWVCETSSSSSTGMPASGARSSTEVDATSRLVSACSAASGASSRTSLCATPRRRSRDRPASGLRSDTGAPGRRRQVHDPGMGRFVRIGVAQSQLAERYPCLPSRCRSPACQMRESARNRQRLGRQSSLVDALNDCLLFQDGHQRESVLAFFWRTQ